LFQITAYHNCEVLLCLINQEISICWNDLNKILSFAQARNLTKDDMDKVEGGFIKAFLSRYEHMYIWYEKHPAAQMHEIIPIITQLVN